MAAEALAASSEGRREALVPAALLLVAGLLTTVAPLVGVVRTEDGSDSSQLLGGAWWAFLPAVVVLVLIAVRPALAVSAAAGAGLVLACRAVADLGLRNSPLDVLRPEQFALRTSDAVPLRAGFGVWLLLVADLAALVAVLLSAGAVLATVPPPREVSEDGVTRPRIYRSPRVMTAGLVAAALLVGTLFAATLRGVAPPPGLVDNIDPGITGIGSAALVSMIVALLVILAASIPAAPAAGLLIGAAAAVAVPAALAIAAPLQDIGVSTAPAGWLIGLAALLLVLAGLLGGTRTVPTTVAEPVPSIDVTDSRPTPPWLRIVPGALALVAAGFCTVAAVQPQVTMLGRVEETASAAVRSGYWPAAITLYLAGALALAGPRSTAARIGRIAVIAAATLAIGAWGYGQDFLAKWAVAQSGPNWQDLGSIWDSANGMTLGMVAAALSGLALVAAVEVERRSRRETDIPDDHGWDERAPWPSWVAAALTVLICVTFLAPTYRTYHLGDGPQVFGGVRLLDAGSWLGLVVTLVLLWWAARTEDRALGVALLPIAAVLVGVRWYLPAAVSDLPEFTTAWGRPLALVCTCLLLLATPALHLWHRKEPAPSS